MCACLIGAQVARLFCNATAPSFLPLNSFRPTPFLGSAVRDSPLLVIFVMATKSSKRPSVCVCVFGCRIHLHLVLRNRNRHHSRLGRKFAKPKKPKKVLWFCVLFLGEKGVEGGGAVVHQLPSIRGGEEQKKFSVFGGRFVLIYDRLQLSYFWTFSRSLSLTRSSVALSRVCAVFFMMRYCVALAMTEPFTGRLPHIRSCSIAAPAWPQEMAAAAAVSAPLFIFKSDDPLYSRFLCRDDPISVCVLLGFCTGFCWPVKASSSALLCQKRMTADDVYNAIFGGWKKVRTIFGWRIFPVLYPLRGVNEMYKDGLVHWFVWSRFFVMF